MKTKQGPLKSWDIYAMYLSNQSKSFRINEDIKTLSIFKDKYNWNFNISSTLHDIEFDAIVLTSANREIAWVNRGFTKMTGYPIKLAIGKKPSFLQGEQTSKASLGRIRKRLKDGSPFTEYILNYKKNGSLYKCELNIYPIKNYENTITHFIAFEKELKYI
ncbi:PAS domain-containing protein [Cognatitamlana onchidii]|uniref:PAS domain-containing protein n=1 Tax=Cognatitamlana onchidii TaxID=2562860 RepID=UPI0010A5CE4A|nr:PAS domain-containing protein [Algibacter onchidii]